MKIFLALLVTSLALTGLAQQPVDPRVFGDLITPEVLKKHLYIIAGSDFEGRETATEGQRKAADYIQSQFASYGLSPGYQGNFQMFFPVFQDSLAGASLQAGGQSFQPGQDFSVNLAESHSETLLAGEVVFAGYGISDSARDDYLGLNVRGKVLLLLNGLPPELLQAQISSGHFEPYGKQDAAQAHGAIGLLIVQDGFPRMPLAEKGNMYVDGFRPVIRPNTYFISEKVARSIMGHDYDSLQGGNLRAKTYKTELLLHINKLTRFLQSSDVLGYLEGTDLKDQLLVISAHYDHLGTQGATIFYGADDDGSGTASVLVLAQAFAKAKAAGHGPRRSILFLANSGEEKGLWGSKFYTDHPNYPLEKTTADLNIDMVGRIDPKRHTGDSTHYVYIVGDDKISSDLRPISVAANKKYTKLDLDYQFNDPRDPLRIFSRSDHYNFARHGVPIIFYFDGIHQDYHKPTDTPDKINFELLQKRAQLVFYTAWDMANRQEMLKRDIPLKK
jgi:Peptidase family M28/PA domain